MGFVSVFILCGSSVAFAALTFSGTGVSSDANITIDGSTSISIGTSTATSIIIGRTGTTTTFPGNLMIDGFLTDGGGNPYVTSTGASVSSTNQISYLNGATSSVSRTLTSKLQDTVSVKDFGATGNGTTDDTAAIQAAVNAAARVYFPSGTYKISSAIILHSGSVLYGSGRVPSEDGAEIKNTGSGYSFSIPTSTDDVEISDMWIDSESDSAAQGGIFVGNNFNYEYFSNLYIFLDAGHGVGIDTGSASVNTEGGINIYAQSVRVDDGSEGFRVQTNSTINDVTFIDCYSDGATSIGFDLLGIDDATLINSKVDNDATGYKFFGANGTVIDPTMQANTTQGMVFYSSDVEVSNPNAYDQLNPFVMGNATNNITLINPVTAATPSGYSVTNASSSPLQILNTKGLDAGISGQYATMATDQASTTASLGGSALAAGACTSTTATISGATSTNSVSVSPQTYPGDGIYWEGYISSANTVTVKVCAVTSTTPVASLYNVRVIQ